MDAVEKGRGAKVRLPLLGTLDKHILTRPLAVSPAPPSRYVHAQTATLTFRAQADPTATSGQAPSRPSGETIRP